MVRLEEFEPKTKIYCCYHVIQASVYEVEEATGGFLLPAARAWHRHRHWFGVVLRAASRNERDETRFLAGEKGFRKVFVSLVPKGFCIFRVIFGL